MDNQELEQKFRAYEQRIIQLQEQLQAIEKALSDMNSIKFGLDDLKGKKDQKIRAPLGRGIYIESKLSSENLIVDIGEGKFVKKSIDQTKKLIEDQMVKIEEAKKILESDLEKINQEITKEIINSRERKKDCGCENSCECDEEKNCNCGYKD